MSSLAKNCVPFIIFFKFHFALIEKPVIFALPFTEWNELVAQLVEQYTFNVWVLGSSPSGFTLKSHLF